MDSIVKGLVIRASEYKESDKLLTLLTLEKGKIVVKARGVKKQTSKLKPYCQSFCFADFELADSHGTYVLTGVNLIDSFFDLTTDFDKFSYACAVLEVLDKVCVESEKYEPHFISALKTLKAINYSSIDPRLVLSKFMLDILHLEGFAFNIDECAHCEEKLSGNIYIDFATGELVCDNCKTSESFLLEKSVYSTIKILSNATYDNLSTIKISKNILDKTVDVLSKNLSIKFDIRLNSLKLR